jgi:hypothetical protein
LKEDSEEVTFEPCSEQIEGGSHGNSCRKDCLKRGNIEFNCLKNALSSLLCLCLLFIKIRDKGRTSSAWKQGGKGERARERDDPNNVCICELMNNKRKGRKKKA